MATPGSAHLDGHIGTALVTGASGFVGRHLCAALTQLGIVTIGLHRHDTVGPWARQVRLDLSNAEPTCADLADVDTVFHLAGNAHVIDATVGEDTHRLATVTATRNLLAGCSNCGVQRVVFVSTVKAVGEPGRVCVDESFDRPALTAYGRAKRDAEDSVIAWGRETGRHAVVLRPTLVVGPGVKGNFRRLFDAVRRRRFPPLPDWHNHRSIVHVDDLVQAMRLVAVHPAAAGERLFVCYPTPYSTRDMVNAVRAALGRPAARFAIPEGLWRGLAMLGDQVRRVTGRRAPFDSEHLARLQECAQYNPARLEALTGFVATKSLDVAVADLLEGE